MKTLEIVFIPFLLAFAVTASVTALAMFNMSSANIIPCGYSSIDDSFNGVILVDQGSIVVNNTHGSSIAFVYDFNGDVVEGNDKYRHPEHRDWVADCMQKVD